MAIKDVWGEITGKIPDAEAFEQHRLEMAQTVWECNGLISCNISKTCYSKQKGNDHEKTLYPRI
jgi:nitrate/TMAO reductase-like tetraheme cytochrome c subunit